MRIGVALQYGLAGSGSCIYARSLSAALAAQGHEVHVLSHEANPGGFGFFTAAWYYPIDGPRHEMTLAPPTAPRSTCVAHCIEMRQYPVAYPRGEMAVASPRFVDLSDEDLALHLRRLREAFRQVLEAERLEALLVNHEVVLPIIARGLADELGVPYAVIVHGSTLEYVVRCDRRYAELAVEGLEGADAVVVLNGDVWQRVLQVVPGIAHKLVELPVGVDASLFRPVPAARRRHEAGALLSQLAAWKTQDGMTATSRERLRALGRGGASAEQIGREVAEVRGSYRATAMDVDIAAQLGTFDWERERVVVFVGKLLVDKGVHCLLAAARRVLRERPDARFVIIGSGAFREGLEILLGALDAPPGAPRVPLDELDRLARAWEPGCVGLDHLKEFAWDDGGPPVRLSERVTFTGYLGTRRLSKLVGLSHVGVVPSVIPEAFPLVVLEAAASGVVPLGTRLGGLEYALESVGLEVAPQLRPLHVDPSPARLVADLADKIVATLRWLDVAEQREEAAGAMRTLAESRFSWDSLARDLVELFPGRARATDPEAPRRRAPAESALPAAAVPPSLRPARADPHSGVA